MKKKVIICVCLSCFMVGVIIFLLWFRPFGTFRNVKPSDDFSKKIVSEMNDYYTYIGNDINNENTLRYNFIINKKSKESLKEFFSILNNSICYASNNVEVVVLDSAGTAAAAFCLYNYSKTETDEKYYSGFYRLCISSQWLDYNFWNDCSTYYECMEGIKELEIPKELQDKALEDGTDWFAVWPNLNLISVYDAEDLSIIEILKRPE